MEGIGNGIARVSLDRGTIDPYYELTDERRIFQEIEVRRIRYLKPMQFGTHKVEAGQLGGWLQSEKNLSQEIPALVLDDAVVMGDAIVHNGAVVKDYAVICGTSRVSCDAIVGDTATVCHDAYVESDAKILGAAKVGGEALVLGATIRGAAEILENARVQGGDTVIDGNVRLMRNVEIVNSIVTGQCVLKHGEIFDAKVTKLSDVFIMFNNWSSGHMITWTRSNNLYKIGCFIGTAEELLEKAKSESIHKYEGYKLVVETVKRFAEFNK